MLKRRSTRFGLNIVLVSLIAFGIAIFANMIANEHDLKKDFTKGGLHSLEDQSIKVLKGLKEDVKVKVFFYPQFKFDYENLFDRFNYYTKKLKVEYLDWDRDQLEVMHYKISA